MSFMLASWLGIQTWAWGPVPDAVKYRIYWGASGTIWCSANRVEFSAAVCSATECQGDIPMPTFTPAYFIATAVDAAGNESPTEHGAIVSCP